MPHSTESSKERRRAPRRSLVRPVQISGWAGVVGGVRGYVRDVSAGGCCVELHGAPYGAPLPSAGLRVRLRVPWTGPFVRPATQVAWWAPVAGGDPTHYRLGLSFVALPAWQARWLALAPACLRWGPRWIATAALAVLMAVMGLAAWDAGRYEARRHVIRQPVPPRLFVR